MIAHVGGLPVEESLLPLVSGLGTGFVLLRAGVARLARRSRPTARATPG